MLRLPYKKLKIWEKAMYIAILVHEATKHFPKEEIYGLTSQLRRSATSIPSNIAEGSQRTTNKDFANFILIARGSLAETETQIILASNFKYIKNEISEEILNKLNAKLKEDNRVEISMLPMGDGMTLVYKK